MNLKEQRAAAFKAAQKFIAQVKAGDVSLVAEAEAKIAEVKSLDEKLAKADEAQKLFKTIGPPDEEFPPGSISGGHLQIRGIGSMMAQKMSDYSATLGRKGIVPAGEVVVPVPIVNTTPIENSDGKINVQLIEMLPVVARREAVYKILRQQVVEDPGSAGMVAPGDLKPTKKLGVTTSTERLKVLAVLSDPQDRFMLEDGTSLKSWVGDELARAIWEELEYQVISGDGTGENLLGISNVSGIQIQAFQTDPLITLQYGLAKLEDLGLEAGVIALSSEDWLTIQTTRNTSGNFDVGGPIDAVTRKAWGTQVVVVPGLTPGAGYVIGTDALTLSTDTHGIRAEWGTPGDNFSRNQITARVEGRFNLDVLRPHGIVKMTLTDATP